MRIAFTVVVLTALLLGCKQDKDTADTKMVFKYNQFTGISSLDPAFSRDQATMWATHQIFDGLVEVNEQLEVVPCIARSWELSDDGKRYIFHLRGDVRFHDHELFEAGKGRKVIASDFVYSFNRLLDENVASTGAWLVRGKVTEQDPFVAFNDSTLIINLAIPYRPFLSVLTLPYFSVVPKEVVDHYGKDFRTHPVGSGPFAFKLWDEQKAMFLEKNTDYFMKDEQGKSLPYLDGVKISFINDRASEFEQFRQGNLDFMSGIDPAYKNMIIDQDGSLKEAFQSSIDMFTFPYLNTEYLGFSLAKQNNPVIGNKKVRQAINMGFDREKMIQYLRNGIGIPAHAGMIPAGLPSYDPNKVNGYQYDIKKAKSLLKEAGYENGEGTGEITLYTSSGYIDMCTFISKALEDIGLTVKVEMMEAALQRELMRKNDLDFFRGSWIGDFPDGENYLALFYGKNGVPPNYTFFKNERFDQLYELAVQTSDPSEYIPMYHEMENIIVEEAPVVPLYYDEAVRFVNKNVKGLPNNAMNLLDLKKVWLE
ncbi:MAG: ABC transporter substrate-binding protein [Bacteroidetes bacterium]|nr:ABC transporter substrate-binding protein [Bacteroidota bacterium]